MTASLCLDALELLARFPPLLLLNSRKSEERSTHDAYDEEVNHLPSAQQGGSGEITHVLGRQDVVWVGGEEEIVREEDWGERRNC